MGVGVMLMSETYQPESPIHTVISFDEATRVGTVLDRSGYHQPHGNRHTARRCGCELTTSRGAYRDVEVDMGTVTLHYYHQSLVAAWSQDTIMVRDAGYQTATTKRRINSRLPTGYRVIQRDCDWYVETPDGRIDWTGRLVVRDREDR
jgi:hypothetical protein